MTRLLVNKKFLGILDRFEVENISPKYLMKYMEILEGFELHESACVFVQLIIYFFFD